MYFNSKLPNVGTTIFTVMSNMAKEFGAVNLSQGFPDFEPDPYLLELATQYFYQGKNQYAQMTGVPVLRERLSEKFNALYFHTTRKKLSDHYPVSCILKINQNTKQ